MFLFCDWTLDHTLQLISIIVDGIASVGAIVAIIFASKANNLANQANLYARTELKNSVDAQIQSKNVELFDKRLSLLNTIEKFELPSNSDKIDSNIFSKKTELHLLFRNDKDIKNDFDVLEKTVNSFLKINWAMNYWENNTPEEIHNEIYELEDRISTYLVDVEAEHRFCELCDEYIVPYEDETGETEYYNYYCLREEHSKLYEKYEETKERLVNMMKTFISASIEDENNKKDNKK